MMIDIPSAIFMFLLSVLTNLTFPLLVLIGAVIAYKFEQSTSSVLLLVGAIVLLLCGVSGGAGMFLVRLVSMEQYGNYQIGISLVQFVGNSVFALGFIRYVVQRQTQ